MIRLYENDEAILFMLVMVGCSSWIRSFSMISSSRIHQSFVLIVIAIWVIIVIFILHFMINFIPIITIFMTLHLMSVLTIYDVPA